MIGAYDEYGNVVDLVEWKKQIRTNAVDECIKVLLDYSCVTDCTKIDCTNCLANKMEKLKKGGE